MLVKLGAQLPRTLQEHSQSHRMNNSKPGIHKSAFTPSKYFGGLIVSQDCNLGRLENIPVFGNSWIPKWPESGETPSIEKIIH